MPQQFELNARARSEHGTGAARRLRREGGLPAVVYGAGKPTQSIALDHATTVLQLRSEAFHSHLLKLNLDGAVEDVVLREVRYHPVRRQILHMDLLRVSATQALRIEVPLHFTGEEVAPGVKLGGGVVSHLMTAVEIECLPKDLPEYIEIDVSALELNATVHLSDLALPAGVSIPSLALGPDHDLPVVSIHLARAAIEEEEAAQAEPAAGTAPPAGEGGTT
jgi:large subunit ribosomal protein L25